MVASASAGARRGTALLESIRRRPFSRNRQHKNSWVTANACLVGLTRPHCKANTVTFAAKTEIWRSWSFLCLAACGVFLAGASVSGAPLVTRWAAGVSATNVLPEYPRPQQVREAWQNLNGQWDCAITGTQEDLPSSFPDKILVPFPVESFLSGVGSSLDDRHTLWYRRRFRVPPAWRGNLVHLHFGAVDWNARVFVNGRQLGVHRGGYDAFSIDISGAVNWEKENELIVAVMDPTEGDQPRGKQSRKPEGIFYTASSGIWQTVWLEPVPVAHVSSLRLTPDVNSKSLRAMVMANTLDLDLRVEVIATFQGKEAGRASGAPGREFPVPLSLVQLWSPRQPSLYDVEVTLRRGSQAVDRVRSYFGLRDIRLGTDEAGARRLFLNGQPLFQMGVLDQGFWPDGLYTAPSDEALRSDLETARRLGFNLVRKHVKVEPERWYYWADKLGMLVWQDMPSGNNATEAGRRQFEMELQRLIDQRANHPSIIMWVLFNEGWGQFETERLAARLKVADPTRLVDSASGWTDLKVGDVIDLHRYPDPIAPAPEPVRAGVLGEFGGLGLGLTNHIWSGQRPWGYQLMPDAERLVSEYTVLLDKVWGLQQSNGLAAAVYTQLTDVETECNGFLTYDREVLKMDAVAVRRANLHLPMVMPNAQQGVFTWSFTTNPPPAGWVQPDFDASAWQRGAGGFGTRMSPNVFLNTEWKTSDIWLRREFTLAENAPVPSVLLMYHDEDAEVYINGVLAVSAEGYIINYKTFPVSREARQAMHPGRNVIAVHCHQTTGGQYFDAGLPAEPPEP